MRFLISIISHHNVVDIKQLIENNMSVLDIKEVFLLIRFNVQEDCEQLESIDFTNAKMAMSFNEKPAGFGENHNKNFNEFCETSDIFIVCNPDIERISNSIFQFLKIGCKDDTLVVPKILNEDLSEADFRRQDLKLMHLLGRLFNKKVGTSIENYTWVPSIFKCFTYGGFKKINGYDENIFMYYEDYDICMRAKSLGIDILISESDYVVHRGTRESRKSPKLLFSHIKSVFYVLRQKYLGVYRCV